MPRVLSTRMLAEEFDREGAFSAIKGLVDDGSISNEKAGSFTETMFSFFGGKVTEAKSEVQHLSTVLARLDMVCRAGPKYRAGARWDTVVPQIQALAKEVTTFDNWVISLYETDLSMIGLAAPERAKAKPGEMAQAMAALRQKRLAELDFSLKDTSLFKRG